MLPRIDLPMYAITLPVSGKSVEFRAYTAREEKLMIMAKEAGEPEQLPQSIKQIIVNCTGIKDPDELCQADKEYILIQLRAKVNGHMENLDYICKTDIDGKPCNGDIGVEVDLNSLTVDSIPDGNIQLTKTVGVKFHIPSIKSQQEVAKLVTTYDIDRKIQLMYKSLESIYDTVNVTAKQDITFKEFEDWFLSLPSEQYNMIMDFFASVPSISFETVSKCKKCGTAHTISLRGIDDFFRF